jgi:nucleoside-diphosphate-sugar epimerase
MAAYASVLVTGGAGYVGSRLVPKLLEHGWRVRVLDMYYFGRDSLRAVKGHPHLEEIAGDIRNEALLKRVTVGVEAVIHLAAIANDPSVELDPALSRSINYDSFRPFLKICKSRGVKRFIFASSSSVYGVSEVPQVMEDHPHVPASLYNKYKSMSESVLWEEQVPGFTTVAARPATVCGRSPRQRLDLTVNILTNHAVNLDTITVFGGQQQRPNLHIEDMVDVYLLLLEADDEVIAGQAFNAGYENHRVEELAAIVRRVVRQEMPEKNPRVVTTPTDDIRSYHISSEKICRLLGFMPKRTIEDAVRDLIAAFVRGDLPNSINDVRYYNVRAMKAMMQQMAV